MKYNGRSIEMKYDGLPDPDGFSPLRPAGGDTCGRWNKRPPSLESKYLLYKSSLWKHLERCDSREMDILPSFVYYLF